MNFRIQIAVNDASEVKRAVQTAWENLVTL